MFIDIYKHVSLKYLRNNFQNYCLFYSLREEKQKKKQTNIEGLPFKSN